MREPLVYCSHALIVSAVIVGVVRFSALPAMARLLLISLICAIAAELIGKFRGFGRVNPEAFFNVYALTEGVVFIAGAFLLLRRPAARALAWFGVTVEVGVVVYQHLFLQKEGFNIVVYLTQSVIVVALYLLVLAEAVLDEHAASMSTGVLLICVAVLVYCSLAPLSFPATNYFYYKGKLKLASHAALINTISCVFRYGLTVAAFLILPRPAKAETALAT